MVSKLEHFGITKSEETLVLQGELAALRPVVERALEECQDKIISTKHLLLALLEQPRIANLFRSFQEDPVRMRRILISYPANDRYGVMSHVIPGFTRAATKCVLHAADVAKDRGLKIPEQEDLLLSILDTEELPEYNSTLFDDYGLDRYELIEHILDTIAPLTQE